MKKRAGFLAIALLVAFVCVQGCASVITPAMGTIYSDVKGPWTATSLSGSTKVGTSECTSILGIVAQGDASIEAAMRNGGITKIHHVDTHTYSILGVYAKLTVRVYGE
jgi:hypothetical protein